MMDVLLTDFLDPESGFIIWLARLGIYAFFFTAAYFTGRFAQQRKIKSQMPRHQHRPVEGCLRCQIDKALDL